MLDLLAVPIAASIRVIVGESISTSEGKIVDMVKVFTRFCFVDTYQSSDSTDSYFDVRSCLFSCYSYKNLPFPKFIPQDPVTNIDSDKNLYVF